MTIQKIAIIRRNGLGDFISATVPVCLFLQERYPEAQLHFFMSPANAPLVKYFFKDAICTVIPKGNKYLTAIYTALKARSLHFDIGIATTPSSPKINSLFLKCLHTQQSFLYTDGNSFVKTCVSHPFDGYDNMIKDHVGLINLRMVDSKISHIEPRWYPKIDQTLLPQYEKKTLPVILVEVSNNRKSCQLSNQNMELILNTLAQKFNFTVEISTKSQDIAKAQQLQKLLHMPAHILQANTLDDYIAKVNTADIFLIGDGGLGHIAGALDKYIVSLFGVTPLHRWAILSDKVTFFSHSTDINQIPINQIITAMEKTIETYLAHQ